LYSDDARAASEAIRKHWSWANQLKEFKNDITTGRFYWYARGYSIGGTHRGGPERGGDYRRRHGSRRPSRVVWTCGNVCDEEGRHEPSDPAGRDTRFSHPATSFAGRD